MRILPPVKPSAEQLQILSLNRPGVVLLRGAAGSGKTTTALLRLRQQCRVWLDRRSRLRSSEPVRVLVLTYNRTLEGYISELAEQQVAGDAALHLTISTFSKWARGLVAPPGDPVAILDNGESESILDALSTGMGLPASFVREEVDYVLSRFPHDDLDQYLTAERRGRGRAPRMSLAQRQQLLDDVIYPYQAHKIRSDVLDWNDLAVAATTEASARIDVLIVDEAQDFSANQMRAVLAHLSDLASVTIVMDTVQRIYPRAFTWSEVGVSSFTATRTLRENHRNTRQIAAFARSLVADLPLEDDGTLPDFSSSTHSGALPTLIRGRFGEQVDWALAHIFNNVDLDVDSVAFLFRFGGRWPDYLRRRLTEAGLGFADITRLSRWPRGSEQIAISTFHSAKGLEFDHVFMLGLNQEVTTHRGGFDDVSYDELRRLVAMAIGRAHKSVVLGYKVSDPPSLLSLLDPATFDEVDL